jgi:lactate dehydrogenase-like 2-hydroxyacid dehydrogenase
MSRPVVVVTRKLPSEIEAQITERYDAHLNRNDTPLSAVAMGEAMKLADGVLCTVTDKITAAHFTVPSRKARVVANFGVGVNHIDLDAARAAGVMVTNTPDVLTDDTADLALALIVMTARRLGEGERHVRSGAWSGWRPTHMLGRSLRGKVLGIVGYGRIGRAVARRAASALGMRVQWWAPREPVIDDVMSAGPEGATRVHSLETLLGTSDVVSLHCPATPETRHLMNAGRIAQMPSHGILINTARGNVIDEHALVHALREQVIASAGLDVYEFEPTVLPDLRDFENVVLLPHLGSATVETRRAMGERALENLAAALNGDEPRDRVV